MKKLIILTLLMLFGISSFAQTNLLCDPGFDSVPPNNSGQFPLSGCWTDNHIGQAGSVCDGAPGHFINSPFGLHLYTGQAPADYLSYPTHTYSTQIDSCYIVTAGARLWNPDTSIYGWVPGSMAYIRLGFYINNNWVYKYSPYHQSANQNPQVYQISDTVPCGTNDIEFTIWLEKPQVNGQSFINVDSCYLFKTLLPASPLSVMIYSVPDSIHTGELVSFYAVVINGGCSPNYQWKKNGMPVGLNSSTYISNTLVNGDIITCTVTSNAVCVTGSPATSNQITIVIIPWGINDNDQNNFVTIFPNPANDKITIESLALTKNEMISFYNIQGQLLIQQPILLPKEEMNISKLAKGIYIIKFSNPVGIAVKKFIKQ